MVGRSGIAQGGVLTSDISSVSMSVKACRQITVVNTDAASPFTRSTANWLLGYSGVRSVH